MAETKKRRDVEVLEKPLPREKTDEPFRVLLHNDDYTTMDFVVEILERIFHKSPAEANRVMMQVHVQGSGVAGIYPHEVAETKVEMVHQQARANGYPLRASLEES